MTHTQKKMLLQFYTWFQVGVISSLVGITMFQTNVHIINHIFPEKSSTEFCPSPNANIIISGLIVKQDLLCVKIHLQYTVSNSGGVARGGRGAIAPPPPSGPKNRGAKI